MVREYPPVIVGVKTPVNVFVELVVWLVEISFDYDVKFADWFAGVDVGADWLLISTLFLVMLWTAAESCKLT